MLEKLTKRVAELTENGNKEIALLGTITIESNVEDYETVEADAIIEDIKGLYYYKDDEEESVYLLTTDDTEIPLHGLEDCEDIAECIMNEIDNGDYQVVECVE